MFPCRPRSRLGIWSRETPSVVPSRVILLILYAQVEAGFTHGGIGNAFRNAELLFMLPTTIGSVPSVSGLSISYRWRSLPRVRWDRATILVLKVVPVTGAAFSGITIDQ